MKAASASTNEIATEPLGVVAAGKEQSVKKFYGCICALILAMPALRATDTLAFYVIDTEGGKAVIVQTPGGEAMLIDAGNSTRDGRDTKRVVTAAQAIGIKQFDYILATPSRSKACR